MSDADKVFAGAIPQVYENLLVPILFAPYARDMAERVEKLAPRRLLEVAAGTGVVTRELDAHLSPGVAITATDLNEPMLDIAKARQPPGRQVAWQQADALALPFQDESFDAVVCQFGVMFFPDKQAAYRQAHRIVRPRGHYVFSVWDRIENNHFPQVIEQALAGHFPDDPPRFLGRTPYGHWQTDPIRTALAACGFRTVTIDRVEQESRAASARDVAIAYCQGTPLKAEIEARAAGGIEAATVAVEASLVARFGRGAITGRMVAHVVTASC